MEMALLTFHLPITLCRITGAVVVLLMNNTITWLK
jgi:hypothetical protein